MNEVKTQSTFLIKSSKYSSFGTGFVVYKDANRSYLATCAHVIDSCGKEHLTVNGKVATLIGIGAREGIDLAIISVDNLNSLALLLDEVTLSKDTPVTVHGYKEYRDQNRKKELLKGKVKKYSKLETKQQSLDLLELSLASKDDIQKGYSGSAVINSISGYVVAVTISRFGTTHADAIPLKYLKEVWEDMPDGLFVDYQQLNPYKGLFHFTYKDRANYFGREKESKKIANSIKKSRFFTLLGASGSGKSSLLLAGVLPLIEGENISVLNFRPEDKPFKNLANSFIPTLYQDKLVQAQKKEELTNKLLSGEIKLNNLTELYFEEKKIDKLYIIIDQFEELFTLTKDIKIKNHFLDQLLSLINSNLNTTIIISLRADFLSFASYYEPCTQAINQNPKIILGLMSQDNLKRAIVLPAKKLGVRFESGLIERILEEISKEVGQLPLLEFALEQFWQKMSDNRTITHKSLDEMGSISHAISYHADKIYQKSQNQEVIRRIFLKLVNVGRGTEDTRRVAKFEDFDKNDRETITLLANDRLVITTENSVEVVHEALIREWSVLKTWIEEYREFLEWQERVREDRVFYEEKGDLLKDSKLLVAKDFLGSHRKYISDGDSNFIQESILRAKEKRNKGIVLFVSLFLAISSLAFYGFWQKGVAEENEQKSEILNKKLFSVVDSLFDKNTDGTKIDEIEIYQLIIDEFKDSSEKEIIKIVEWSYYNMGVAYVYKKEYSKAIEAYQKTVEINPQYDGVYYDMVGVYMKLKQFKNAIESYIDLININPKRTEAYTNLFELQLIQRQSFDEKLEKKYIELFQNKKETFIHYKMLKILHDITHNKKVNLKQWKRKYRGVEMGWSFDILDEWIDGFDEGEVKERLREAIGVFKTESTVQMSN